MSIYHNKLIKKSDHGLLEMVLNHHQYDVNAILTVIAIIEERGLLLSDTFSASDKSLIIEVKNKITSSQQEKKERVAARKKEESFSISWLPKGHIFDLIGYYALCIVITIVSWFPFHEVAFFSKGFVLGVFIIIPFWQGNILAEKAAAKREIHFHERSIFAIAMCVVFLLNKYFINNEFSLANLFACILVYILALVGSGLFSLFFYHIKISKLASPKFYFLKVFRWFTAIAIAFVLVLTVFEEGWFVSNRKILWDENKPLTVDDFEGYTNLFSHYDGAISSYLNYEFDEKDQLIKLNAICNSAYSWINPWDRDSYFLLQHEKYHFNITEMVARMARKAVIDTLKNGADKEGVLTIINRHKQIKNKWQTQYDNETDHSVISDMQGYWQYKIDSMLFELDPYWTSDVLIQVVPNDTIEYYRDIRIDATSQLIGCYPLMNGEENYTRHYRFYKDEHGDVDSVSHHIYGKPYKDQFFSVYSFSIDQPSSIKMIWKFYNKKGELMANKNGYAVSNRKVNGNFSTYTYYDKINNRVDHKDGIYESISKNDSLGRKIETWFLNDMGQRVTDKNQYSFIRYNYEKFEDFKGNQYFPSKVSYYDLSGINLEPVRGVAFKIFGDNKYGISLFYAKKDRNGQCVMSKGDAIQWRLYNELGMTTEFRTLNTDSLLSENKYGFARFTWSNDRYGNTNRYSTYNSNNVLAANNEDYVASQYTKYDTAGNRIMYADYGTGDELIFNDGFGKVLYNFDSLGRMSKVANFNGYDYPILSDFSTPVSRFSWDSSSLIRNQYFFTKDLEKDTTSEGEHHMQQVFDQNDNLIETSYYNLSGELKAVEQDVALFKYRYDSRGNKLESRFYNTKKQLAFANQGVSINKYVYDENNFMIERTYHDSLGQLAPFDGVAKITYSYDKVGNEIELRSYDKYRNLLDSGVAVTKSEYDSRGNNTIIRELNNKGQLIKEGPAVTKIKYNEFDEIIEESYFDDSEKPTEHEDYVHKYVYHHDDRNQYMGKSFFDKYNQPVKVNGVASISIERDERGNNIHEMYLSEWGEPAVDEEGVSLYEYDYDLNDRMIEQRYYDPYGLPFLMDSLYSKVVFKRNRAGDIVGKSFYDSNNELTLDADGVALYKTYMNRNNVSSTKKYDVENALKLLDVDN
ncbi:MAG: hypothetical protein OCD76_03130 [Reichenbachiella sp.]